MERVEVTDEWLYKYMPVVDAAIIQELECLIDKDYEFSHKFKRQMRHLIRKEAHPWIGIVKNLMKRVAVFLIGVIGATLIFTMGAEAYRKKFFETIKTFFSNSVFYNYSMTDQIDKISYYIPTYIPNGYKEIEKKSSDASLGIVYEDQEGKLITWNQTLVNEATTVLLDTEYNSLVKIEFEDGRIDIALYDSGYVCAYYEYDHYIFILTADYLSIEEVVFIIESMALMEE